VQERILEGVNDMVGDIVAEVINTLEMLEMKKGGPQKHARDRRSWNHPKKGNDDGPPVSVRVFHNNANDEASRK